MMEIEISSLQGNVTNLQQQLRTQKETFSKKEEAYFGDAFKIRNLEKEISSKNREVQSTKDNLQLKIKEFEEENHKKKRSSKEV